MDRKKLENVRNQIRIQLDGCIEFWLNNGIYDINRNAGDRMYFTVTEKVYLERAIKAYN